MRSIWVKILVITCLTSFTLAGQSLNNYRWKVRPVIVFTPSVSDPLFVKQYELLQQAAEELKQRQVILMMATAEGEYENSSLFMDKSATDYYYDYFGARRYQLELVLVGLDGTEKFRAQNTVTPASVLIQLIDSMPMRRQELQGLDNKSQINSSGEQPGPEKGGG